MWNPDILCLSSIDQMPQYPTAIFAMGIHLLFAVFAFAARRDARNYDPLTLLEVADGIANFLNDADAFVAQYSAIRHGGNIALEDVKIRPANRRLCDSDDRIGRPRDLRH